MLRTPNNENTEALLEMYTRRFNMPPGGLISLRSACSHPTLKPWRSLVTKRLAIVPNRPKRNTRGGALVVRVRLQGNLQRRHDRQVGEGRWKPADIAPRPHDFWKDLRFLLTQDGDRSISGEPQFSLGEGMCDGTFIPGVRVGAYVYLDYDARPVPSQKTRVEVFTPDREHVVASFDLGALR